MKPAVERPLAVLDTNVALALWLFADAKLETLRQAIDAGDLLWLCSPAMLQELRREVRPERCVRYSTEPDTVLQAIEQRVVAATVVADEGAGVLDWPRLRCTDSDDQKFVDVALRHRASWLLTRDRAVLKLARRALPYGVVIQPPQSWVSSSGAHKKGRPEPP